ncbi:MAG: tRNA (adenine(22)-N(1))-methyltransferase TrmK [Gammaproteobacteria bacterium]|jgi:release factor glutamine methyltransferase
MDIKKYLAFIMIPIIFSGCGQSTAYRKVVEHPGNLQLIYYGYMEDSPDTYKVRAAGKDFFVTKSTVVPSVQSVFLLEHTTVHDGDDVLDIGTGAGIQAIFAAEKAHHVVATDLNQDAVNDAIYNAKYHGLSSKIDVRQGDLFAPIKDNEKFDTIILNIEYPYNERNKSLWAVHERFFAQVKNYMKPGATIFYQAGYLWNIPKIVNMIESNDLMVQKMFMVNSIEMNRQPIVFVVQRHPNLNIKRERLKHRKEG